MAVKKHRNENKRIPGSSEQQLPESSQTWQLLIGNCYSLIRKFCKNRQQQQQQQQTAVDAINNQKAELATTAKILNCYMPSLASQTATDETKNEKERITMIKQRTHHNDHKLYEDPAMGADALSDRRQQQQKQPNAPSSSSSSTSSLLSSSTTTMTTAPPQSSATVGISRMATVSTTLTSSSSSSPPPPPPPFESFESAAASSITSKKFTLTFSATTTTAASYLSTAKAATWLLPLLSLITLFGCGYAGFACLSNPCVFGVCIDGLNSSYSCYCIDGYTGIQCQTNWDECWSGPCQNGGTCVDGVAYYNCTCPEGFTGANCEENVDECKSNPCQNGGQCRDRNNGYTCSCQPGYLGVNCEIDVAVCEAGTGARCQNGGECVEGPGLEFSCECTAGWHGRICQEEINECESAPCQNGGVCVDKLASYVCACPMGYTGTNCEEEILICADNPCQNNALCLMEEGVPTCYCVPDYHGEKCEYQYDECQLGPRCMNGGVCIDGVDTFSCSCPPLLTGMLCECLMIGEDSLDCNYTAPSTVAPPTSIQPPMTPAAPTTPHTVDVTTIASTGTASAESAEGSVEEPATVSEEEVRTESGPSGADEGAVPAPTVTSSKATVSEEDISAHTTEPSVSYSEESVGGGDSGPAYSTEVSAGSEETVASKEFTTVARFDVSQEVTTAKVTSAGVDDDDYLPTSQQQEETSTKARGESEEEPAVITITARPAMTHHVTTIETSVMFEYSTPKIQIWSTPAAGVTVRPSAPEPTESPDYEVASTSRIWSEISTPTAPFFTEYPAVYVTTSYHDLISKDMDTLGEGIYISTLRPTVPPPTRRVTTVSAYDYESVDATPLPATSIAPNATTPPPTHPPYRPHEHATHKPHYTPPATTTAPQETEGEAGETTTARQPHHPATSTYLHPGPVTTTTMPPAHGAVTTMPPPDTEDLITQPPPPSQSVPVETTKATPTLPTTTEHRSIDTYAPTTLPPAFGTPTEPTPTHTKSPTMTSAPSLSSEEIDSSNSVAPAPDTGGDNITDVDCVKTGCYHGGTCVTTSEGSRCVCRFDRQGALCESPIVIKNAAFSGDSYVSHRIHKDIPNHDSLDAVLPMHVQLKVRTRATNGLIMLAAAQGTKGGHYMALFLQKGLLQFQFSCGLQTMLLSELETPVNTGHEITIRAELDFSRNYTHCNASLLVNDTLAMSGDQPTWLKLLPPRMQSPDAILNTWLHLGGAPQAPIGLIIELPPAQSGTGFTGCLHSLRINGDAREIFGDALDGFGITECGSLACLSSPCRNGAACIKIDSNEVDEHGEKAEKWKCKCPTGYMGPTCEISVCEDNPCQYGGTCVQFPGSGYLCLCPLGKHGHYCEHNLEVALPSFSGSVNGLSSYVAYTVPIPLEYSLELSFKILPQTMSQISLLAFLGQGGYHDEKSDHLAVSFIQGYIMLTWNLGGGPRRIFTQKPIDFRLDAPRVPYEVKVGRIGRQAWLSVDGKFNITGRSPGTGNRMDVVPILYLGGHEIANFNTLPHDLPLHSGFQGCIYDVHLKAGQVTVPLQETRGVRGRGVGQCGTRECHRHACQHDGACLQHGATFTCICQEGWYGPLCAQPTNPCDSFNNKCADDATCVPLVNGYECDCPVGKTGKNCDEEIRSLSDVSLTGRRSYLAVRWPYLYDGNDKMGSKRSHILSYRNFTKKLMPPKPLSTPSQHFVMKLLNEVEKQRSFSPVPLMGSKSFEEHHRVQFFFIEFQLRPLSERGLLLYFGTLNNNQDKKIGFVSLSLQGGMVEFRVSGPSSHVTVVRSVRMLAIGEWHKIKMAQRGRWLTLWVEGSASSALAPSAEVLVEPDSLLYVGGLKDLSKLPPNAISGFPIPFRGCVRGLVVSGTRIVLNETNIVESRNIRDCDGTACGGDSCESGGHCWLDEKLQPHCICPEYAKGDRCEYSETCKLIPCKNNGRCLRSGRCSCPNGWGGFYCEIAMSKPTTPSFRGNSYLILPPPRIPVKDKRRGPSMYVRPREAIQISLNFSTIGPDGLLLWSEHDRSKFLGLGLENGHLKIASNLLGSDNDTVATPTSGYIADGGWHAAKIILDRTRLELHLDGEVIFTEKLGTGTANGLSGIVGSNNTTHRTSLAARRNKAPSITYEDLFYLGGFPNMDPVNVRTRGRFDMPFKGCLQDIQFGAESNAVITDFSTYKGENIGSCDLHGDEPVVV